MHEGLFYSYNSYSRLPLSHTFTKDEQEAAEELDELFGLGWPERGAGKVISFASLSQMKEGLDQPEFLYQFQ